ncbi:hypothetical protein [Micromonospora sp. NPDC047074]|uniref:hypothetical protein n=1 Tax=Micromonospora sp. NPDC047074 TaxID=3154339 RepID=UPI0033BFECFC
MTDEPGSRWTVAAFQVHAAYTRTAGFRAASERTAGFRAALDAVLADAAARTTTVNCGEGSGGAAAGVTRQGLRRSWRHGRVRAGKADG